MENKLEKGISIIRNFAKKYKSTILQRLKPKTVKTIDKKNKKRKKAFKILELKNGKNNKENKIKKLDEYLIHQEMELDFQENYSFLIKYNTSCDLLHHQKNNKVATCLKVKTLEIKNDEKIYKRSKINFVDSLDFLEFKIKNEIQKNNDLLFLQSANELNEKNRVEKSETSKDSYLKKIPHTGRDSKSTVKKSPNGNKVKEEENNDKYYTKKKKRKNSSEYKKSSNYERRESNISMMELNENAQCKSSDEPDLSQYQSRDNQKMTEEISSHFSVNSKKKSYYALFSNNASSQGNEKDFLVLGENHLECMNKTLQNVSKENVPDQNIRSALVKSNDPRYSEDDLILCNEFNHLGGRTPNNMSDKTNETYINEHFKGNTNRHVEKVSLEKNNNSSSNNENNVGHIPEYWLKSNVEDIKPSQRQQNAEEFDIFLNEKSPLKEDNCFDLFFNEQMATPSIFHM
ncbi:conserved Plasmodium protein, unknown function [Plasmodium ovale wallikeri]|uniref:Uncharacterized protein n=2 Tax=Plasmodium ovale TaxID=36330 RepID=A0A1A9A2G1_PLAOA|nr:conserved Plasmodium protein, unknown function [Plasmodium ovale wallikeri]SBT50380.1 conserved Plasmodium protein, unknown function [Plasmodium ovale wallikeri]SBT82735.1 conserved Plasmodium protein, unknown function [Plasmodium ovale]